MRPPAPILVVDTSILLSTLVGRSTGWIAHVGTHRSLITTARAEVGCRRRLALGLGRPDLMHLVDALLAIVAVRPAGSEASLDVAASVLRDTVPSRNGSAADAHLVVAAWAYDADIWSHDRDYAGTGVPSWSSINLLRALIPAQ